MTEVTMEEIEGIIKSVVSRNNHDRPSKETLAMIDELRRGSKHLEEKVDGLVTLMEDHNAKHESQMEQIIPIIKEFQERQIRDAFLKDTGEKVKWIAGVGIAFATLWLFVKGIWKP